MQRLVVGGYAVILSKFSADFCGMINFFITNMAEDPANNYIRVYCVFHIFY